MEIFEPIKKIKPKTWLKSIWWFVIVFLLICFLYPRIDLIQKGNAQPFDIFLFLILISLLVIPLFQEVEFFGIKLKKEIDELKQDIKTLTADIKNTINFNSTINVHPPTDEGLKITEEKLKNSFTSTDTNAEVSLDIPVKNVDLFKIRFEIEKELRRIIQKHKSGYEPIHAYNMSIILSDLYNYQIISGDETSALRDVIAICNLGIHNKPITPAQIDFVKEIGIKLINKLKGY